MRVERRLEVFDLRVMEGRHLDDASVVDEHVDAACVPDGTVDDAGHVGAVAHVTDNPERIESFATQPPLGPSQFLLAARDEHETGATTPELAGKHEAQAA
jgi:hypothetical protein